jgi:pimeloyl-ACP methyl ester carboxylesterase
MKVYRLLSAAAMLFSLNASAGPDQTYSKNAILLQDVAITANAVADVNVTVTTNNTDECRRTNASMRRNIVTVHGITHTAATWGPLTEALMNDNPTGKPVCNVFSIDMPGHGKSGMPKNMLFGDMSFQDYANSIIHTVERLQGLGFRTPTMFGFSHGGFLMQVVQQTLVDQGSSLRDKLGVKNVVFFGSSLPQPLSWEFSQSGAGANLLAPFFKTTDELGLHMAISDENWRQFWFTNAKGEIVNGAPSVAQVGELGYNTLESGAILSELLTILPTVRPYVSEGIYTPAYGTRLTMLGYSNDLYISTDESIALYEYLTGDERRKRLVLVDNDQAVHNYHMAEPADTLVQLTGKARF